MTIINGVELPAVDWTDAEIMDAYNNGLQEFSSFQETMASPNMSVEQMADKIREMSDIIADWADSIFGEGAGDKLFGGKASMRLCNRISYGIVQACQEDMDSVRQEQEQLSKELALRNLEARGNRQERRAAAQQATQGKRKKRRQQQLRALQAAPGPVDPATLDRYDPRRTEQ